MKIVSFCSCFVSFVCSVLASDAVTVYNNTNYSGITQKFGVGKHNMNELTKRGGVGNDTIKSLRVKKGYKVILYIHSNFGGESLTLSGDTPSLGNRFNNKTSSLIVEKVADDDPPVTIYSSAEFKGNSQSFGVGRHNTQEIQETIGTATIGSIKVRKGYKATLYRNSNFSGRTMTYDYAFLAVGFTCSSIVVEKLHDDNDPGAVVTIYPKYHYQGNGYSFGIGKHDADELNALYGTDVVNSIKIAPGYQVILYKDNKMTSVSDYTTGGNIGPIKVYAVSVQKKADNRLFASSDPSYKGWRQYFSYGKHDANELSQIIGKNIRSINYNYAGKPAQVIFHKTDGTQTIVQADSANVGDDIYGKVDSIEIRRIGLSTTAVTVGTSPYLKDGTQTLKEGDYYSKSAFGLNGKSIKSIYVPKGFTVILFEKENMPKTEASKRTGRELGLCARDSALRIDDVEQIFGNVGSMHIDDLKTTKIKK